MPSDNRTGEAQLAAVHSLEAARPEPTTYAEFYAHYGIEGYATQEGSPSTGMPVDGRVLHIDELQDRATHLIVHELYGATGHILTRRCNMHGVSEQQLKYLPDHFFVMTFNGIKAQRWAVKSARSIHTGPVDLVLNRINPHNEIMHLKLAIDPADTWGRHDLIFNRGTGEGRHKLEHGYMGWILSAEESAHERARVLQPQLGHIATAS